MKQRRINATLTIAALALTALLILTVLPWAGAVAPTVASLSTNPKRISESAVAHSFIRSPFVDSTPGTTTRISAAPRLERQPLESLTALNSTDLEAEAAATERGAPLSVVSVPSVASVVQSPDTTTTADAQNVELVGQIGGSTYAVAVQGNYAYLGVGPRLVVLDVSDPANPTVAGQTAVLPGAVYGVHVVGDYAYVANLSGGLQVVDVSNPAAPVELGACDTPGVAYDVHVADGYAYIADGHRGLRVVDVSNPAALMEVGAYSTPGEAQGVYVAGSYAYVVGPFSGLRVVDVSNPAAPVEVGAYSMPGDAQGVYVAGGYAYVAGSSGLRVVDVSNPTTPVEVGFYDPPGYASDVFVVGPYAYVADWSFGLRVVDVSNPTTPVEVGAYSTYLLEGVYVSSDYAYVVAGDAGLRVINVSDPAAPVEVGTYTTSWEAWGVHIAGAYAYVAAGSSGLRVVNVSDPTMAVEVGAYDTPGYAEDVYVAGDYAYVADRWGGMRVIDVSDPATPVEVGSAPEQGLWGYRDVYVAGHYAYVATGSSLRVIDVSNPTEPMEMESMSASAESVYVAGNYAYTVGGSGLRIFDVSNPTAPVEVGACDTPGSGHGIYVADNYAYVADGYGGLRVVDVSNPATPVEVGAYDTSSDYALDVYVTGGYAYVGDEGIELRIVDVSNSVTPYEVGTYDTTPGKPYGVYVASGCTYLANMWGGLLILRFTGGPPIPFLDLPFDYRDSVPAFAQALQDTDDGGRVSSWFDHAYPDSFKNQRLVLYDGRVRTKNLYNPNLGCYEGRCYDGHNGIDFARLSDDAQNLPIRAAARGIITETATACTDSCRYGSCSSCDAYGNYVVVDHQNGYFTRYAHLKTVYVSQGQTVTTNDTLGIMGSTGRTFLGTHLHFGVYRDNGNGQWDGESVDKPVDPYGWKGAEADPWVADHQGPTSHYLWIHSLSNEESVSGDQGATMTDTTGHVQVTIPPGAFSGQATFELSPVPEAEPSAQLRSTGRSFWLRLLEWVLESGGLQGYTALQSTAQFTLTKPITFTVTYTDTDVLHLDVNQLALHRWDQEQETWQSMTTTVDLANHAVTAQTEDLGDFDLQAPLLCATDDLEPDDGYAAARWVWPNDWPLARGLDIPQDSDWVRFDAVQGAKYTIRTENLAGGADTVLNLYDVDALTLLDSNDDAGGGSASELVWTAPYTGTFFIETVSAPGGTTDCSATYELTIATIPGDVIADCQVDTTDIMAVASRWRLKVANPDPDNDPNTPNYETRFDLDRDGDIDIVDIMLVVKHWGERCP